jgi:hypothetical protein
LAKASIFVLLRTNKLQNVQEVGLSPVAVYDRASSRNCCRYGFVAQKRRKVAGEEKRFSACECFHGIRLADKFKNSPPQKSIRFGRTGAASIHFMQKQKDASCATAEQFACLPIPSVPRNILIHSWC